MQKAGSVLEDRYELQLLLATGGMGQVWRARDLVLGRQVAVKVLRSEYTGDAVFLTRFRTEARLSAGLVHPNVAVLHDYGEVDAGGDRLVYLVMELVEGEPLSTVLQRERRLSPTRALDVLRQAAAGLAAAHAAGVVHRDVKPGNVLVGDDGTVKITDFGIAWSAANAAVTRTGHVVGTAQYLAPEQVEGAKATAASDVYSWGMVAYECLAGRRAFDGDNPVDVAVLQLRETPAPLPDDVPEPVRRLVDRTLVKDPAGRIADGAALLAAIDEVVAPDGPARFDTLVMPAVRTEPETRAMAVPLGDVGGAPQDRAGLPDDDVLDEASGSRRWGARVLVPLVVALLAVAAVATGLLLGSSGDPAATSGPSAVPTPSPSSVAAAPPAPLVPRVRLVAAEHVGRPVDRVQAELTGLDLVVVLRAVETTDVPAGAVTALEPVGDVPVGTTVTVTHAVAPPPPPPPPPPPVVVAPPVPDTAGEGDGDDGDREERRRERAEEREDRERDRGRGRD
ncbi:serine/threonine protein kinase [Geodermatophilus sabuli]|uniref:non-specific serine/threonine protein kinase n=1 Tax=Geodermatophilus sabuli TaxID=1564158 RepID=A0A7K3VWJ0_9ACTN|nr:serine/threonine-protein kinase [Geodermatophilus sabuli]NEK57011.1 serine/threonine protein kinase [Geodermatophilus sabuli]